jgi:hypothetical protein
MKMREKKHLKKYFLPDETQREYLKKAILCALEPEDSDEEKA